jgi:hypothetical protein
MDTWIQRGSWLTFSANSFILLDLLICGGNWCLPSAWLVLRGSCCFFLYIVYFAFLLLFLYTHLGHVASPVIVACICLIMFITVLG